jgi:hypothetical protein
MEGSRLGWLQGMHEYNEPCLGPAAHMIEATHLERPGYMLSCCFFASKSI